MFCVSFVDHRNLGIDFHFSFYDSRKLEGIFTGWWLRQKTLWVGTRQTRRKVLSTLQWTFLRTFCRYWVLWVVEVDHDFVAVNVQRPGVVNNVTAEWFSDFRKAVQQLNVVLNFQLFPQECQRAGSSCITLADFFQLSVVVSELFRWTNVGLEKALLAIRVWRLWKSEARLIYSATSGWQLTETLRSSCISRIIGFHWKFEVCKLNTGIWMENLSRNVGEDCCELVRELWWANFARPYNWRISLRTHQNPPELISNLIIELNQVLFNYALVSAWNTRRWVFYPLYKSLEYAGGNILPAFMNPPVDYTSGWQYKLLNTPSIM